MFTGIVQGRGKVKSLSSQPDHLNLTLEMSPNLLEGIAHGASIAVDGVCLTVTRFDHTTVSFDLVQETLEKTTLSQLKVGNSVNMERALRMGDELGGHLLSGHIIGRVRIDSIQENETTKDITFACEPEWMKYLFHKGYVAIDGISLTLGEVDPEAGRFSVHLIPETLGITTLGQKSEGDACNLEIDHTTQIIVDSIERMQSSHLLS